MKQNKGFTLIELLAVIVVLAIIALVAVPTILGVIDKAKKGAAEASAYAFIEAVELYLARQEIENFPVKLEANHTYQISNKTVEVSLLDLFVDKVKASEIYLNDIIKIKGEYPTSGYVVIGENYKVNEAKINVNGYEVSCNDSTCNVGSEVEQIPEENITIVKNKTFNLNDGETLESTDSTIATVQGLVVTVVKDGNVTINVLKDGKVVKKYLAEVIIEPIVFLNGKVATGSVGSGSFNTSHLQVLYQKLTDGILTQDSRYGSINIDPVNNNYLSFEVKIDSYISFKSNNYSDGGGSTNKKAMFYSLDESDNKTLYYELQMDTSSPKYGKKLFKKGKYYLEASGRYVEFDEWFIEAE